MAAYEEIMEVEDSEGNSYGQVKLSFRDRSKAVAQTKEMLSKQADQTKQILSKQMDKIAKQAEEHERFINKVTHLLGVLGFGGFCFVLGARPQDVRYLYCLFYIIFVPLRWIYYRYKKWHYYLLDFCYYANTIFLVMILGYPRNKKLFLVCFSFAEGPLAWALIVWRCSLVFNSMDKISSLQSNLSRVLYMKMVGNLSKKVMVLQIGIVVLRYTRKIITELGILVSVEWVKTKSGDVTKSREKIIGLVFFTIRWWDPLFFEAMHPEGTARRITWPYAERKSYLWTWLFFVPLVAYSVWQLLYFLIVNVLRRQRLLKDPEVMTSYRELSKKAQKANNIWWRLNGLLGDKNRLFMYTLLQAIFTVATMALAVPIFLSYKLHIIFQFLKVAATVWNGGSFLIEVMPRQFILKEKKKTEMKPIEAQFDQSAEKENLMKANNSSDAVKSE